MKHFGCDTFAVVAYDRSGRVGHRMAIDHSDRVTKLAVIDIVPTYKLRTSNPLQPLLRETTPNQTLAELRAFLRG